MRRGKAAGQGNTRQEEEVAEEEPTCGAVHQRDGGIGRYGLPLHLHLELGVEVLDLPHC